MVRSSHTHPLTRSALPILIGACLITSFLPLRWLGWSRWFSEQAWVIVSPIAQPITMGVDAIFPRRDSVAIGSEREAELLAEIERIRLRLYQAEQRSVDLESLVQQLARGAALHPDVEVTQLPRPRIGESGDLLIIRAGTGEGVHKGTVVAAQSVQVIGRVSDADARTSRVLPITARSAPRVAGVVILDDEVGRRASCLLEPVGDGTLRGEVSPPDDGRADELAIGQTVRLLDEQWPRHAQMLVIGEIERIEPSPTQPLRRLITVRPRVDARRVSEVIVRLPGGGGG